MEEFLTPEDFKSVEVSQDELELINGHPSGDSELHKNDLVSERVDLDRLLDKDDIVITTKTGQNIFRADNYQDIRGEPNIKEPEVDTLSKVPIEEQRVIKVATAITGKRDGKYRSGYLSNLVVAQRYIDEEGKWPQKDNRKPYRLLTKAEYSYIGRRDGKRITTSFEAGSVVWMPKSGELKMNDKDRVGMIQKIKSGFRR